MTPNTHQRSAVSGHFRNPPNGLGVRPNRAAPPTRTRGVALVVVMLAVAIALVLALAFISAQATTTPVAQNVDRHTSARAIAESAVVLALHHVRSTETWRNDFAAGDLPTDQALGAGSFTITAVDGEDVNGDGIISGDDETDGDILDDNNDVVTLLVTGRVDGVTHQVRVVVRGSDDPGLRLRLLLVCASGGSPLAEDLDRQQQFEDWGYEVTRLSAPASADAYNAAIENHDIVYVSATASAGNVGTKLNNAAIGVVFEQGALAPLLGVASSASTTNDDSINILNNAHDITRGLPLGVQPITAADVPLNRYNSPLASTAAELAATVAPGATACLIAVDAGATLTNGNAAAGRRAALPVGGSGFTFAALNSMGLGIVENALTWASRAPQGPPAVGHWRLDESEGTTAQDSNGTNHGTTYDGNSWTVGKFNNAMEFDGINDYIQIPNAAALQPTAALSICAWVRGDAWSSGDNVDLILRKGEGNPNNWQLSITNGKVALSLDAHDAQNGNGNAYGTTTLQTGRWYHVVGTWDGKTMRIYVDGAVDNGNGKIKNGAIGTDTRPVYLGGRAGGDSHDRFDGLLDDVRLYNRALSGSEIRVIMNEAIAADAQATPRLLTQYDFMEVKPNPALVGRWTLDDSTAGGGGLAANDQINLLNKGRIDSYRSTLGPYNRLSPGRSAVVGTNSTRSGRFHFDNPTSLWGTAFCGVGGSPNSVIDGQHHNISGKKRALSTAVPMPDFNAPSGMPSSQGNVSFSNNRTLNSDATFSSLSISGSSTVTVSGARKVLITGDFNLSGTARIVVPAGSSLALYVGGNCNISGSAKLGTDSAATSRITVYAYNNSGTFRMSNSASACATLRADGDAIVEDTAEFYGGATCRDDLTIDDEAQVHLDLSLPNLGVDAPPCRDLALDNDGRAHGPNGGATGAQSWSGTALRFDGADYVEVPHNDAYLLGDGAVSFWFKTDSASTQQGLFSKDSDGYDTGGQLTIQLSGSRVSATLESTGGANTVTAGTVPISSNTWYHVALTFGQNGLNLYINGTLAATNAYRGGLGDVRDRTGNFQPILLGASGDRSANLTVTGWRYPLRGYLDDVRIYDYALDATQVAQARDNLALSASTLKGPTLHETSGMGAALNIPISNLDRVTWIEGGGLQIDTPLPLKTRADATKLQQGAARTGQLALEFEFTPSSTSPGDGVRPIAVYGGPSNPNFVLEQDGAGWRATLRTSDGSFVVNAPNVLIPDVREHVILSYDGAKLTWYRNHEKTGEMEATGNFNTWTAATPLAFAGKVDGSSLWQGRLYRFAAYDRALNIRQAANVFNRQPPGNGGGQGSSAVRWIE